MTRHLARLLAGAVLAAAVGSATADDAIRFEDGWNRRPPAGGSAARRQGMADLDPSTGQAVDGSNQTGALVFGS